MGGNEERGASLSQETILYHCAPIPLGEGAVIEPGNWGRLLRSQYYTGSGEGTSKIIFEVAYEAMRLSVNPQAPSRLDCIFCCPTHESAQSYRDANAVGNLIYRVAIVDARSALHLTSWSLWGLGLGASYQQSQDRIRDYWISQPTENLEVLVGGSVRVVERMP